MTAPLPARDVETDDERRLREAINRHIAGIQIAIDAALRLRNASGPAQRARNIARTKLDEAALWAMQAVALNNAPRGEQ